MSDISDKHANQFRRRVAVGYGLSPQQMIEFLRRDGWTIEPPREHKRLDRVGLVAATPGTGEVVDPEGRTIDHSAGCLYADRPHLHPCMVRRPN